MRRSRAFLVLLGSLLAGCASEGGGSPVEVRSVIIDQGGGTIAVTTGDLEGVALTVPPGGVDEPVEVSVLRGFAETVPGFRPVSLGVVFTPNLELNGLPSLTLPIGSNAQSAPDTVILQSVGGEIVELGPGAVNLGTETVTANVPALGTYWAGERLFGGLTTELDGSSSERDLLPLNDGDTWTFDNGVTATMEETNTEPNLGGANVFKLTFATTEESIGFYLQRADNSTSPDPTQLIGFFSTTDGATFQRIHDTTFLLPGRLTVDQRIRSLFSSTLYAPFGAASVTGVESGILDLAPSLGDAVVTPVGTFNDRLRLDYTFAMTNDLDEVTTITVGITFIREVGPAAVSAFGVEAVLESGTVGGTAIGS